MDITHSKVPSLELTVEYDGGHFAFEGHKIEVKFCTEAPTVSYDPHTPDSLYTLLIVDPDAPSRMKPTEREYVQWMVVNIKGDNVEGGQIVLPYQGPSPPHKSGLHRYVIQLYKQNGEFNAR
ncbi:phosphatidylethanolamine-binding protein, partial [Ochromonadaceae sp. CCMP2298]